MYREDFKDPFVEQHKEEIEREAFKIYRMREHYLQPDDSIANFLEAIHRVKVRYGGERFTDLKK